MFKICIHSIVTGLLIFSKIAQFSSNGGRLICIEMTGYQQTQGLSAAMGGVGAVKYSYTCMAEWCSFKKATLFIK